MGKDAGEYLHRITWLYNSFLFLDKIISIQFNSNQWIEWIKVSLFLFHDINKLWYDMSYIVMSWIMIIISFSTNINMFYHFLVFWLSHSWNRCYKRLHPLEKSVQKQSNYRFALIHSFIYIDLLYSSQDLLNWL